MATLGWWPDLSPFRDKKPEPKSPKQIEAQRKWREEQFPLIVPFEATARDYCKLCEIDPDEPDSFYTEQLKWHLVALDLLSLHERLKLLRKHGFDT